MYWRKSSPVTKGGHVGLGYTLESIIQKILNCYLHTPLTLTRLSQDILLWVGVFVPGNVRKIYIVKRFSINGS